MSDTPRHIRPRTILLIIVSLLVLGVIICLIPMPAVEVELGPDTTVITSPLQPDGMPDYVAALDEIASRDVTPENNAAPLILQALGREMLPDATRDEALRRLGLSPGIFSLSSPLVPWSERPNPTPPPKVDPSDPEFDWRTSNRDIYIDTVTDDLFFHDKVHPDLKAWLDLNTQALDLLTEASHKSHLYLPVIADPSEPNMVLRVLRPGYGQFRSALEALAARSMFNYQQHAYHAAIEDVLAIHRMARLLGHDNTLVGRLVALSLEARALQLDTLYAAQGQLPSEDARYLLDQLMALAPTGDVIAAMDTGERFMCLDSIIAFSRGKAGSMLAAGGDIPSIHYDADWNQLLRMINSHFDDLIAAMKMAPGPARKSAYEAVEKRVEDLSSRYSNLHVRVMVLMYAGWPFRAQRTDAMASLLVTNFMPALGKVVEIQDRARVSRDLAILALSLHLYHAKNGTYPSTLDALAPDPLPAIPMDRFSGKSFIYKPDPAADSYLLYSVGYNFTDDAGQNDDKTTDDITVTAPPVPPDDSD